MRKRTKRIIYIVLGIFILAFLYALKNTSYFARSATFIFSIFLFYMVDVLFKLKFKNIHYLTILAISTFGILLSPLYWIFSVYDKVLHFSMPILVSFLVYYLVDKIEGLKFQTKLFLTLSITTSILAFWEIVEFSLDKLYDLKLQGVWLRDVTGASKISLIMDRINDTMVDLILGVLGSLTFGVLKIIGYFYKKFKIDKKISNFKV